MLIQPITNQKYNTNLQKTKPSTSFRGQLGNKVIQNIEKNGVKNIDEVLKILGITGASTVIISNLKDLLESVSEKFDSHKNELQESEQAVANVLKGFKDKEKELNERENALINTESLLKEAEIEKIKSEMRVVYGGSEKVNGYSDYYEQLLLVTQLVNNNIEADTKPALIDKLINMVQNNEGVISKEMMIFLENILKLSKNDDNWQLPLFYSLSIVKDENGNLDQERAAYLIARSSLKGQNLFKGYLLTYQKFIEKDNTSKAYYDDIFLQLITNNIMLNSGYILEEKLKHILENAASNYGTPEKIKTAISLCEKSLPYHEEYYSKRLDQLIVDLNKILQRKSEEIKQQNNSESILNKINIVEEDNESKLIASLIKSQAVEFKRIDKTLSSTTENYSQDLEFFDNFEQLIVNAENLNTNSINSFKNKYRNLKPATLRYAINELEKKVNENISNRAKLALYVLQDRLKELLKENAGEI